MHFQISNFSKSTRTSILLLVFFLLGSCGQISEKPAQTDPDLFSGFQNPPAEARPFVRWWWNGNRLQKKEIVRQLDVLHKAGIGGLEINPIAMPEEADDMGIELLIWRSKEWNEMLQFAALEVQKRGMLADLIVGSGWPFGGEFLEEDETIQRIIVHKIPCSEGQQLNENLESLYRKAVAALSRSYEAAKSYELVFIRLVPSGIQSTSEITDLTADFKKENRLELKVPAGNYELVYGILQRSNREVMHRAPGAAGPVMNHYEREITRAYLNRLNKISDDTGMPLSELLRALFCDSIELDGANWTNGFEELFFETYSYRLEPWFPFIFYDPYTGYPEENYNPEFADQIKRARYDYNKLLVKTFLENFTQEFQDFCTERGLLCRYQAYGTPFLMGMMEGNMIADIPESNNWIYSADMDADEWEWNQGHGYMIWNMYAASGGHLTGKKIISNEAMTNTRGVFKASLEEIKQHDDMNFITGMNHAVLHGYNYSPEQAEFPGWIRYGSYFSERNPWWPYFSKWVDYNARLSYVFQNSAPVKSIAILAPEADIWASHGLTRNQFHTDPWYCYRLWETISQAGSSCDYIGQNIIREGKNENGSLTYGPMSYQTILLSSVQSLESETALALFDFVKNGGKLVAIGEIPNRSLSFQNAAENDVVVQSVFTQLKADFPNRFFEVSVPDSEENLLPWALELFGKINIQKDVEIDIPEKSVWQIHKKAGDRDIWFFTNSSRVKTSTFKAVFPTGEKTPWIWNPEDGTRLVFPYGNKKNELEIELNPLQSLLLVFEPGIEDSGKPFEMPGEKIITIEDPWEVSFEHVNGETFTRNFNKLNQFGTSPDEQLNTFAGTVTYKTTFSLDENAKWLQLGKANKGVTEVFLNGEKVGMNWHGKPVFNIENAGRPGENLLEIKYTTVLSNYVMSLENNPTAERWTRGYEKIPTGLEGEVTLFLN
ncbi:MAG TPA: hypothetical protein ENN90_03015 [Mariniphaga anaerophila]|uniref:Alpha-L-rhamnosidase n=1 Tax=Mariniphaga anaerophila TaxID=1484053 RepID=A0A831LKX7_9BACT|nr:hypothetical protein [Mariniphaga anaerophila]